MSKQLMNYYNRSVILKVLTIILIFPVAFLLYIIKRKGSFLPKMRRWYAPKYDEYRYFFSWDNGKTNLRTGHIFVWLIVWFIVINNLIS